MFFSGGECQSNTRKWRLVVHLVVPLLLSAAALAGAWLKVYSFAAHDMDYGLFSTLLWNFANGNGWHMPLYAGEAREFFLADHLALLVPVWAPFFILFPSPYTLSVLHGLAFAATFFLVPVFVREVWKQRGREDYLPPALFLLLALSFSKGFCGAWWFQSHMTTLVVPFLLAALIALHRKALVWACLFCLMLLLAEERSAVAVFGVGMYAAFITHNRRLGVVLCAFSTLYFFAAVRLIIPFFAGEGYFYNSMIQPLDNLLRKVLFLFVFFLGWYFLPLLGKRAFWAACCALPVLSLSLVSGRETMYRFSYHYQDLPSVFFLAAATLGLLHLWETRWFQKLPRGGMAVLACACLLVSFAENRRSPVRYLMQWRPKPEIARLNAALSKYSQLPPEVKVYAPGGTGVRFSMRKHRHPLTQQTASKHFNSSMVFMAPKQDPHSHPKEQEENVALLLSNPSLALTEQSAELLVFTSVDLLQKR